MSINSKIGVILVNYNGKDYNEECINSIFMSTYKNLEVIVIDNNSQDGSPEQLEQVFGSKIKLVKIGQNLGFSGANNIGIEIATKNGCDYVILLNNDTVIEDDLIEKMINASKSENNAIISPKIYYYDNKDIIWSAGADMRWKKGVSDQRGINKKDDGSYDKRVEIEFGTGCCLLIPIKIINDIGGLSEEYFLYYEDTDYCMKANRKGYKIIYEPGAVLYHKVSASTGGDLSASYIYYNTRNRLIFNNKFNKKNRVRYISYFYLTRVGKIILWMLKGKIDLIRATIMGICDYYKGIEGKKELNIK